jgi:hypothetical protein
MVRMLCGPVLLCVLSLTWGCGGGGASDRPKTYPVSGTVKLNGAPVKDAVVTFQLDGGKESAVGSTDADGKYALSTFGSKDGAVAGQYKITITKFDAPPAPTTPPPGQIAPPGLSDSYAPPAGGGKAGGAPKNLLPPKYANAESSALRATVNESGPNTFDFDLK